MTNKSGLLFLFGLWLSFIGVFIAGISLFPVTKRISSLSPAAVLRAVENKDLLDSTALPVLGKVITINIIKKKVSLYEDGINIKSFRVVQFAEPLSLFEVPSGSFSVSRKEPQHLSRESGLWMSSAIQFSENLFIHGNSLDSSGVTKHNSQGISVELSTIDAKEVYDFASVGMKVIAIGGHPRSSFASSSQYYLSGEGRTTHVTAPSFFVADIETGEVLWQRGADIPREPGKLVTFATALSAVETLDQYKNVRIGELLLDPKSAFRRPPSKDDELPLGSLIYPLLFDANETADKALAQELGSKQFTEYMNKQAKMLNMDATYFLSAPNQNESTTTVRDLFKLLLHISTKEHFLIDVSLSPNYSIFNDSGSTRYRWDNKNPWVVRGDTDYLGGLGAITPSGAGNGMFLFALPVTEFGERTVAFIVVDSLDLEGDIVAMKKFINEHYSFGARRNEEASTINSVPTFLDSFKSFFREDITYDRDI